MTGRERFLSVLAKQLPDRLPCQVHGWMKYYLDSQLKGIDQFEAYEYFGMDPVIYTMPQYSFPAKSLSNWQLKRNAEGEIDGVSSYTDIIQTPGGQLRLRWQSNQFTSWVTEHLIKNHTDFEIWNKYVPVPDAVDWTPIRQAKKRIGDKGIVRGGTFDFGQAGAWQGFCVLYGTQEAIMAAIDEPEWVHHVLDNISSKQLYAIGLSDKIEFDLVEVGGGAASSTVISPDMHKSFCLPYDKRQIQALHSGGTKVVYHLCGGLMPLLDIVTANGADGLETMTPVSMGGDCIFESACKKIQDRMFVIGGFDQNAGFENGSPQRVREMVFELFKASQNTPYICSPSDHFFYGDTLNVQAFANAAADCRY